MVRKVDDFYTRPAYDGSPAKTDFYQNPDHSDFYNKTNTGSEINMREEMIKLFDGYWPEIGKAQRGLFRQAQRDKNGNVIPCPCVDRTTAEPDVERWCPICGGVGYYWTETEIQFYRELSGLDTTKDLRERHTVPGLIRVPLVVFYIRYDAVVTNEDFMVTYVLDADGDPVIPKRREGVFVVADKWPFRSDKGKIEYWKVFTRQLETKWLNAPTYEAV